MYACVYVILSVFRLVCVCFCVFACDCMCLLVLSCALVCISYKQVNRLPLNIIGLSYPTSLCIPNPVCFHIV